MQESKQELNAVIWTGIKMLKLEAGVEMLLSGQGLRC